MKKIFILLFTSIILIGCSNNTSATSTTSTLPIEPSTTASIEKTYTIIWKNWDGAILQTNKNVKEGETPYFLGVSPIREDDEEYTYTFIGWTPEVSSASKDETYTATFSSTKKVVTIPTKYELSIISEDISKGTVSLSNGEGYEGESIGVVASPNNFYTFDGWYCGAIKVSSELSYTFTMPSNDYSLVAKFNPDEEKAIKYGMIPTISNDGKTLTYGLYPQDYVNDSTIINELNKLTNPESNGWYFYNDNYYAKTVATPLDKNYKFDNDDLIVKGNTYWFKCEPIIWNILSIDDGEYLLLSDLILDARNYYDSQEVRIIDNYYVYPNNYEHSSIRAWLNNEFYFSAFSLNSSYIVTTYVDNSSLSNNSIYNSYGSNTTYDNVFLLSYQDYINGDYGFLTSGDQSYTRYSKATDYSKAKGVQCSFKYYSGNGSYWTRSADNYKDSTYNVWVINAGGGIGFDSVTYEGDGVRPSIVINIS